MILDKKHHIRYANGKYETGARTHVPPNGTPHGQLDLTFKGSQLMLEETDKKIISQIQKDLPVHPQPFAMMAEKIGISEDEFIERVKRLKNSGIIRRFGATLRHQEAGFKANAMIAWKSPLAVVSEMGKTLSRFREVSHCYHRAPKGDWPYNLYTMVHGITRDECREIARRMSLVTGLADYAVLFSEKEFKKTSMEYFT
jgi:siroheme decarboxylase